MSTRNLLSLAIFLGLTASLHAELRDARLLTPNTGWALAGNRLLWTSSAGFAWSDITPPAAESRAVYGAYFLDTASGWLLRAGADETPELARTSDAGAHWSFTAFPLSAEDAAHFGGTAALDFADAAHGWAMLRLTSSSNFSIGLLFATSDGGATWTKLPDPPLGDPVRFTSATDGWLTGGPTGRSQFATHDGGRTWQPSAVPPPPEPASSWKITSEGHCTGFKTGCTQEQKLLASSDAGRTWHDITPQEVTPYSNGTGMGQGFDQCAVGTTSAMATWYSDSPYRFSNMYIGGVNRACSQANLNSGWVSTVIGQGWKLIPTWVGLQAPCTTCSGCSQFSSNTSTAASQAVTEATSASNAAAALGLTNTVIYYDLEAYNSNSSCSAAVQAFVNSWVSQIHAKGNVAGVYGSPSAAQNDWSVIANKPDDVWIADWNGQDSVWNLSPLSNGLWVNNQRIHQYEGGHNETYGGVTFNIDTNDVDGAVTPGTSGPPPPTGWIGLTMAGTTTGFWTVQNTGGVFSYNGAQFYGSLGGVPLAAPIVGMITTPDGKGYWLAGSDGGVFSFGDAHFYGSLPGIPVKPNKPVVGIATTTDGKGYWLVGADGGIYSFGDAGFYGSIPGIKPPITLAAPIVGMAATPDGKGYWLVGADGGIYAFGDAGFYGSIPGLKPPVHLNAPITGMARTTDGKGYWLVGGDGGIFTFGDAPFYGSFVGKSSSTIVGIVYDNAGGYMVVSSTNSTYQLN